MNRITTVAAGWSSLVARRAHNPKVVGSNPAPATEFSDKNRKPLMGFFVYRQVVFVFMRKIGSVLYERLAMLIGSMGYELVGCEITQQGRHTVFCVYIDSVSGVTIDDCSKVSHQVSAMLDVEDVFQDRYSLEVSSPGINRPLFEIEHYRKVMGKPVKIRLLAPLNQRRQFNGVLQRVEGEDIYLLVEVEGGKEEVKLTFSAIEKGNLVGDIRF